MLSRFSAGRTRCCPCGVLVERVAIKVESRRASVVLPVELRRMRSCLTGVLVHQALWRPGAIWCCLCGECPEEFDVVQRSLFQSRC